MNKKLLLVRHAKSDWGDTNLSDFNRPLNSRGLTDCVTMAQRVEMHQLIPEKVISSPALRALTTCKLMVKSWNKKADEIELNPSIYEANVQALLKIINELDNANNYVGLFGHNNAITDFVVYLTDADLFNIPTCGIALIEFPFDSWDMVGKDTGDLLMYDFPKNEL